MSTTEMISDGVYEIKVPNKHDEKNKLSLVVWRDGVVSIGINGQGLIGGSWFVANTEELIQVLESGKLSGVREDCEHEDGE